MKLLIGICDDESVQVDAISTILENSISNYPLELIKAYSGEELIAKLGHLIPDVVFLDIEMKDLNGMQTAKKIRERCPDTIIIFITGYRNFALDAFKLKSMDYLIKPVTEKRMKILVQDLLVRLEQIKIFRERNKTVVFSFGDSVIKLKYDEIYFFEKNLRKISVYSDRGQFSFYESMAKLMEKLDMEQFIHCHNSFIVNRSKLVKLDGDGIYIEQFSRTIPVSRKNKQLVRDVFENNLFH